MINDMKKMKRFFCTYYQNINFFLVISISLPTVTYNQCENHMNRVENFSFLHTNTHTYTQIFIVLGN